MSNRFFDFLNSLVNGTKARAGALNTLWAAMESAFDDVAAELDTITASVPTPMADVNLASATTTLISTANSSNVTITGVAAITAFDTMAAGTIRRVTAAGAFTLTHHATALIIPGAANITAAAGDTFTLKSLGSGNWRVLDYTRANGKPVDGSGSSTQNFAANNLTLGGVLTEKHGADIASAATLNLDVATGNLVDVTGTTTVTAITLADGACRTVRFTGALVLTHGASLVLPGGANITTADGTFAIFRGYDAGVVRCVYCSAANAQQGRLVDIQIFTADGTWTKPANLSTNAFHLAKMVGGGDDGYPATAAASQCSVASGGGAGAYVELKIATANMGATESVQVGAGGNSADYSQINVNGGTGYYRAGNGIGGGNIASGTSQAGVEGGTGGTVSSSGTLTGVTVIRSQAGGSGGTAIRFSGTFGYSGTGGASALCGPVGANNLLNGAIGANGANAPDNTGAGGAGAISGNTSTFTAGQGAAGIVIVETYS